MFTITIIFMCGIQWCSAVEPLMLQYGPDGYKYSELPEDLPTGPRVLSPRSPHWHRPAKHGRIPSYINKKQNPPNIPPTFYLYFLNHPNSKSGQNHKPTNNDERFACHPFSSHKQHIKHHSAQSSKSSGSSSSERSKSTIYRKPMSRPSSAKSSRYRYKTTHKNMKRPHHPFYRPQLYKSTQKTSANKPFKRPFNTSNRIQSNRRPSGKNSNHAHYNKGKPYKFGNIHRTNSAIRQKGRKQNFNTQKSHKHGKQHYKNSKSRQNIYYPHKANHHSYKYKQNLKIPRNAKKHVEQHSIHGHKKKNAKHLSTPPTISVKNEVFNEPNISHNDPSEKKEYPISDTNRPDRSPEDLHLDHNDPPEIYSPTENTELPSDIDSTTPSKPQHGHGQNKNDLKNAELRFNDKTIQNHHTDPHNHQTPTTNDPAYHQTRPHLDGDHKKILSDPSDIRSDPHHAHEHHHFDPQSQKMISLPSVTAPKRNHPKHKHPERIWYPGYEKFLTDPHHTHEHHHHHHPTTQVPHIHSKKRPIQIHIHVPQNGSPGKNLRSKNTDISEEPALDTVTEDSSSISTSSLSDPSTEWSSGTSSSQSETPKSSNKPQHSDLRYVTATDSETSKMSANPNLNDADKATDTSSEQNPGGGLQVFTDPQYDSAHKKSPHHLATSSPLRLTDIKDAILITTEPNLYLHTPQINEDSTKTTEDPFIDTEDDSDGTTANAYETMETNEEHNTSSSHSWTTRTHSAKSIRGNKVVKIQPRNHKHTSTHQNECDPIVQKTSHSGCLMVSSTGQPDEYQNNPKENHPIKLKHDLNDASQIYENYGDYDEDDDDQIDSEITTDDSSEYSDDRDEDVDSLLFMNKLHVIEKLKQKSPKHHPHALETISSKLQDNDDPDTNWKQVHPSSLSSEIYSISEEPGGPKHEYYIYSDHEPQGRPIHCKPIASAMDRDKQGRKKHPPLLQCCYTFYERRKRHKHVHNWRKPQLRKVDKKRLRVEGDISGEESPDLVDETTDETSKTPIEDQISNKDSIGNESKQVKTLKKNDEVPQDLQSDETSNIPDVVDLPTLSSEDASPRHTRMIRISTAMPILGTTFDLPAADEDGIQTKSTDTMNDMEPLKISNLQDSIGMLIRGILMVTTPSYNNDDSSHQIDSTIEIQTTTLAQHIMNRNSDLKQISKSTEQVAETVDGNIYSETTEMNHMKRKSEDIIPSGETAIIANTTNSAQIDEANSFKMETNPTTQIALQERESGIASFDTFTDEISTTVATGMYDGPG